jgi:Arc/MetJ family transcription regulator
MSAMEVKLDIDPRLLQSAMRMTGVRNADTLVNAGLRALIARSHARRFVSAARYQMPFVPLPRRRG